jgi:hypothetical protein
LIAIAIIALDLKWVQAAMRKPGWDGQPDADFVFALEVMVRIMLINSLLLPVSLFALRVKRRRRAAAGLM